MSSIRYCWLTPELDFSGSWTEEEHIEFFNDDRRKEAHQKNWRLIKYEVLTGNKFEFPYKSRLISPNAIK